MPEAQDFDCVSGFCDAVKNQIGSANELTNVSPSPHEPASMRKTNQRFGFCYQTIPKGDRRLGIVLSDKSDDFTKVVASWCFLERLVMQQFVSIHLSKTGS